MQGFGSSSVFIGQSYGIGLVQFGYTSGVWTKQMVACNAFGSQRRNCIFQSPALVLALRRKRRGKNCGLLTLLCGTGSGGVLLVTSDTSTAPADDWQLCGSESNTGVAGVRGHRELDTYWHLRGPTEIL